MSSAGDLEPTRVGQGPLLVRGPVHARLDIRVGAPTRAIVTLDGRREGERPRRAEGLSADFALWDVETPALLVNRIGFNPLHARVFKGEIV